MASVLVTEDIFMRLLGAQVAVLDQPMVVRMGESVLIDGLGEIYLSPTVVVMSSDEVRSDLAFDDCDSDPCEHTNDCE